MPLASLAARLRPAARALAVALARAGSHIEPWLGPAGPSPGLAAEARGLAGGFARLASGAATERETRRACAAARPEALWLALDAFAASVDGEEHERVSAALLPLDEVLRERRRLRHPLAWRRALAARRVGLLRDPGTAPELRRALERGPALVTLAAALALARLRDLDALRWLLDHPHATSRRSRQQLAAVLKRFGPGARGVVRDALETWSPEAPVHLAAIEALGLWGDAAAAPMLHRVLAAGPREARTAAARALGAIGDAGSTATLVEALDDYAWPVRAQAARALGAIGDAAAVPRLATRLHDRAWWVRRNAAYALARCGAQGLAALRAAGVQRADCYAAEMAREALQRAAWNRESPGGIDRVA